MNFSQALQALLVGGLLSRQSWGPTISANCLYMIGGQITVVTQASVASPTVYNPVQADILATDWYSVS